MTNSSEFSRQIQKAVHAKDWDSLDAFLVEDMLKELDHSEKENLAQLFFEQGELFLENANELSSMELAYSAFEKSLKLDVSSEKAWIKFAEAHLKLGIIQEDSELFVQANKLFDHADHLQKTRGRKLEVEVLWNWGICLYGIAKDSEEAGDLKLALDKFHEAKERGLDSAAFFLDFGTALGEMGMLLGNAEMLLEAASLLEKSVNELGDIFTTWLRLACTFKILYLMTADVAYFEKADQSFVAAARLLTNEKKSETEIELWLNWGQLLVFEGKLTEDSELITAGLEKLYFVEQEKPQDALILTLIGDALTHLGIFEERFEFFKEAQSLLELALNLHPNNTDIITHLGHCLANMGKYFSDPKYIKQATALLQRGISQEKNNYYLWHGLAMAYFMLAEITQDPELYEKVASFLAQVIYLGGDQPSYWNDWGVALMKLGELTNETGPIQEAVEKFEGAIQSFNQKSIGKADPDWFYNYGCALDWLGGCESNPQYFERAILILSRLLQQYPHLHYIRYNLGLSYFHLGDTVGDVEILEKAIEQFESYILEEQEDDAAFTDLGVAYLTLAEILQEEIKNERSSHCFASAEMRLGRSVALGNTRANYYLACSHSLKNNVDEAIFFLERCKVNEALPALDFLLEDDWMAPLVNTAPFKAFISKL